MLDSGWQEKEERDAPGQVEGGVVDAARDRTRVQAADENERRRDEDTGCDDEVDGEAVPGAVVGPHGLHDKMEGSVPCTMLVPVRKAEEGERERHAL